MKRKGNSRTEAGLLRVSGVLLLLLVILAALAVVSVAIGSAGYSVPEILKAVVSPEQSPVKTIVLSLRLPRMILAILIGESLAASGALLQSVMRNPLADPGTIGVSAGAGTAATTILLLFRLRRRGSGLCAHLCDGLEGRRGSHPDHSLRRGHQLRIGGL